MMKRRTVLLSALALAAPSLALAQARPAYTELRPPLQVEAEGKIEVIEFFWYGCIHCYNLEPALDPWIRKLPPEAQFRRVPAVFNARWAHDAAIYFTFEALGVLDKMHQPFFHAIHRDRLRSDDAKALGEWLQKQGLDPKKFTDTMNSFGVQSKTRRAAKLTADYKVDGTPSMAVHGRYTVGSSQDMLRTVSGLVEQLRKKK
jgi:thiol:disulfide interchange protein DsbA